MSLKLYDLRDLDLMFAVAGAVDDDGFVSTQTLADAFNAEPRHVGTRLSWMRRFGVVDLDEKKRLWSMTDGGMRVLDARIKGATQKAIAEVPDEALIEVMAHVTSRWQVGDRVNATLLRREFLFGTQRNGR